MGFCLSMAPLTFGQQFLPVRRKVNVPVE